MSAIWGMISWDAPLSPDIDERMQRPFREKCKIDHYRTLCKSNVYMGCGIQYFSSYAEKEQLPLCDTASGFFLTADCVLDNRGELLSALQLAEDTPDGTLIAKAYARWGIDCLSHLRGLFSVAIYDLSKKTLFLAADQIAARCLYYSHIPGQIVFSTLLTPVCAVLPTVQHSELFLKDYLTAPGLAPNISAADTPYENIYKLNPGTYLEITGQSCTEHRYWSPADFSPASHCHTAKEYGSFFRQLYTDCVSDALSTSGENGVCLSSGLDSSSVAALAARELAAQKRSLYTYTYVPSEAPVPDKNREHIQDETEDVRKITAMYPNMISGFFDNQGKNCLESLPEELSVMEIPFKAFTNLPNLCEIYKRASEDGCKVLLTGQGGNSTVSYGYIDDILGDLYRHKRYASFLLWLNRYAKTVGESRKSALRSCIRYYNAGIQKEKEDFKSQPCEITNPFIENSILNNYAMNERHYAHSAKGIPGFPMSRTAYRNWVYFAPFLTYIGELETKMGLHYGLLLRDPTKDCRMISFCYHLPYRLFAFQGTPRWLIRGNMRDLLPKELLDDWMRYGVQNSDWFTRIIRDWKKLEPVLSKQLRKDLPCPFADTAKVETFLNSCNPLPSPEKENDFLYLCFLYIMSLYLSPAE